MKNMAECPKYLLNYQGILIYNYSYLGGCDLVTVGQAWLDRSKLQLTSKAVVS